MYLGLISLSNSVTINLKLSKNSGLHMNNLSIKRISLILMFVLALPISAKAQQQQVDPSRVRERMEEGRFDASIKPKVTIKETSSINAPAGADKIKLNLSKIKISGVTVYTADEIKKLYEDKLGKTITLTDVYAIANKIMMKYRNDGYVLTQVVVPPQTIGDKGVVELQVVEGFIDKFSVEGAADEGEKTFIEAYLEKIDNNKALRMGDLEHALLLVNTIPGVSARSVLSPSTSKVGAADLTVIIEHKAYEGSFGLNNYGTKYLGPIQADSKIAFNSLFGNDEQISLGMVWAPDDEKWQEMFYVSASYIQPISSSGTILTLSADNTNTKPGDIFETLDAKGRAVSLSARLDQPLVRSRGFNVNGNVAFDYTNSRSKDNLGGPIVNDRIRVARVGVDISFLDTLGSAGYNSIQVKYSNGVDAFNATDKHQGDTTRPNSQGNQFKKIEAELSRQQLITNDISVLLAAKGQLSNGPLLSGEEFGFGGISWGRGYDGSEIIGDDGYAAKGEIHWREPVKSDFVESYSVFAFYDIGKTWNDDASAPLEEQIRTSTGLGLKANVTEDVRADVVLAFPINRDVASEGDRNPRLFAGVSREF